MESNYKTAIDTIKYFNILSDINKALIRLYGECAFDFDFNAKNLIFLCDNLPRVFPVKMDKGEYIISKRDGIISMELYGKYVEDLSKILKSNYKIVENIIKFRNSIQHQLHRYEISEALSGNSMLITICVIMEERGTDKKKKYMFDLSDVENVIHELNIIYNEIGEKLKKFCREKFQDENHIVNINYDVDKFNFLGFNKIIKLDNELKKIIGMIS